MMKLTNENYFSKEADMEYMSVSQFKAFEQCEAAALASIKGVWERPKTTALLVGSYVDAYFEGTLDVFKEQNPKIFTACGALKAEYKKAEEIINRIESDEEFMRYLNGEKQVIKTGEIEGVPIKIKIDVLHDDKIVDLKIMKDFAPVWKDGERKPWFSAWGYDLQGAVYQYIEGNNKPFILAAATKEPVTDLQGVEIPREFLNERLNYFIGMVNHYDDIKKGLAKPIRCERCDYCKATKKFKVIDARDLYYEME